MSGSLATASVLYRGNADVVFWPSHRTLVKVLSNIVEHPEEAKYRRLNKKGKAFEELCNAKGCDAFLRSLGWIDQGFPPCPSFFFRPFFHCYGPPRTRACVGEFLVLVEVNEATLVC